MIVLDASVIVELLIQGPLSVLLKQDLALRTDGFLVPHLADVEVVSALRGMLAGNRVDPHRTQEMLADLARLPVHRYPHLPLLPRVWELRTNFTVYDATYIALAEATEAILYTCDRKLAKGHCARVRVFERQ